jgi:hypothetical protein
MLLTIPDFTFGFPFQRNTIESIHKSLPHIIFQENTFGQVNHTHQWMARFGQRQQAVKF